jgi:hypothetical protein
VADVADAGRAVVAGNTLYMDFAQAICSAKELVVLAVIEAPSVHLAQMLKQ